MYTYGPLTSDLNLVALGVFIWVVAISIAFGVYLPFLRTGRQAFWARRMVRLPVEVGEGFDHATKPLGTAAFLDPTAAPAPVAAVSAPPTSQALAPAVSEPEVQPHTFEHQPAAMAELAPAHAPAQFSVLIVDDNAINRQVLELILDSVGMAHASVENGQQAVEAMLVTAYDAVLMDLQMPVMDGFEATRRIRELEARRGASHSTIIVVSANCLEEHVVAGREAGADAHLPKPISAGALIGELASCPTLNRMAA